MIIAVNTIIAAGPHREEKEAFIREAFIKIIPLYQQDTFVIISDKKDHPYSLFKNVITEIASPQKNNLLQWYWWLNFKIPSILKKYEANAFLSCDAISFRSANTKQYLFAGDLSFLLHSSSVTKKEMAFYKKFFIKSIKKADRVFTASQFCHDKIVQYTGITPDKILITYQEIDTDADHISFEEREKLKTSFADGHEYFVYRGIIDEHRNILNLLKAFSAFKKRQKSGMQLLLCGKEGLQYEDFKEKLRLFKFKEDVKIVSGLNDDEEKKLISAAYAFISVPLHECFANECLEAMQLSVPVITSSSGAKPEICGDAALYANPEDFQEIAIQMMQLFKDENQRKKLIAKGIERVHKFNGNPTARLIWDAISKDVS